MKQKEQIINNAVQKSYSGHKGAYGIKGTTITKKIRWQNVRSEDSASEKARDEFLNTSATAGIILERIFMMYDDSK